MKKVFALVCALALLCASAVAEADLTPAQFLAGRGLMVLDQEQMGGMGEFDASGLPDCPFCACSLGDDGSASAIIFSDNGVIYAAFDMASAFSGDGDPSALKQVFVDLCSAYAFDVCTYGTGDSAIMYASPDGLAAMGAASDEDLPAGVFDSLSEFVSALDQ